MSEFKEALGWALKIYEEADPSDPRFFEGVDMTFRTRIGQCLVNPEIDVSEYLKESLPDLSVADWLWLMVNATNRGVPECFGEIINDYMEQIVVSLQPTVVTLNELADKVLNYENSTNSYARATFSSSELDSVVLALQLRAANVDVIKIPAKYHDQVMDVVDPQVLFNIMMLSVK